MVHRARYEPPPTKWARIWNAIYPIALFALGLLVSGFGNYMSYTTKVDILTAEVTQLTQIVGEINKKIDDGNVKYSDVDKRLSILEAERKDEADKASKTK